MNLQKKGVDVQKFIDSQRVDKKVIIKDYLRQVKSLFHPSEFKLIIGLKNGLESSLIFEYVVLSSTADSLPIFDLWAFDKISNIYRSSV